ncbi:MAG: glycosyltransferase family 39 protein [Caldilineaceae bacterium]|nr:glycosyltransferase family 39 protein [Caldilineaceae bacterium]
MQSASLLRRRWLRYSVIAASLFILLLVAFWLRWRFIRQVSLDVDEFTTLWAARRILETGLPSMPSGVIYTRGLLNMYITALFGALGGLTYTVGRLPSLFFGLATLLTVFWIGRRGWDSRVGWLVAVALTFIPEVVKWDSSARFYAQLVFFTLLTVWSAFALARLPAAPTVAPRRLWWLHLRFALFFVLALFSQEETILLYPALIVGLWWWRGWRYFLQPAALVAQGLCLLAMVARYLFEIVGQPGYFTAVQTHKSYIDPAISWYAIDQLFLPLLPQLWLFFLPLALGVTVVQLHRVGWRPPRLSLFHQATLFFLLEFLIVAFFLLFVVGIDWHDKRFGLMIQPWWLLAGAAGAIWLIDRVSTHWLWRGLTLVVLTLLIVQPLLPRAQRLAMRPGEGYDDVFAYVAANRQPEDVVMTPQPPVCVFILRESCDYYARARDYEPYVIEQNGVLVDRWSGARLLDSAAQLETVIRQAPRVWLVTDRERLARRYDGDFLRMVVEQFDVAYVERDVLALVTKGWHEPPVYTVKRTPSQPIQLGPMQLLNWERTQPTADHRLQAMLFWQLTAAIREPIHTSLQLVRADGARLTQADSAPTDGLVATDDRPTTPLPDYKVMILPETLAPGRYRLEVVAYAVATRSPLADPVAIEWFTVGPPPAVPTYPTNAQWQAGLQLQGYDALPATLTANSSFTLRLVWSTTTTLVDNYTAFVHLIGPDGAIVAQSDRQPLAGFYPTAGWVVDDVVEDFYSITLPAALAAGDYRLLVGWYQPATGERLPLADGRDALEMAQWIVQE